jgi:hypothetical protein
VRFHTGTPPACFLFCSAAMIFVRCDKNQLTMEYLFRTIVD